MTHIRRFKKALEFEGMDVETVNAYYRKLLENLQALDPRTTVDIANSIWHQQDFQVLPAFLDVNRTHYQAEVSALDFAEGNTVW